MSRLDYKILEGRRAFVGDKYINVTSIKEKRESDGTTEYDINDGIIFTRFSIAIAVSLVQNEIKLENQKNDPVSRFLRKFGLFFRTQKLILKDMEPDYKDTVYQGTVGLRTYADKKCGAFLRARFGVRVFDVELCWNFKDVYEKGELPNPFIDYKKVL